MEKPYSFIVYLLCSLRHRFLLQERPLSINNIIMEKFLNVSCNKLLLPISNYDKLSIQIDLITGFTLVSDFSYLLGVSVQVTFSRYNGSTTQATSNITTGYGRAQVG